MDFCLPCRRHLNGALACPGCGTPTHELHAYAAQPYTAIPPLQEAAAFPADGGVHEAYGTEGAPSGAYAVVYGSQGAGEAYEAQVADPSYRAAQVPTSSRRGRGGGGY